MPRRNYVPPPRSALAPNVAPGREFWNNWEGDDAFSCDPSALALMPVVVDLSKPNATRIALADHFYGIYRNAGQDTVTARANADARALQMVP